MQVHQSYESYFLLEKNPQLCEVQRYIFDSIKTQFAIDSSLVWIRSFGKGLYKVEKLRDNTCELQPLKVPSLSLSMTSL